MSGDYALTSFSSGLWFIKSLMFCKVVEAMFASASRVKKAWCEVTMTLLKDSSRARVIVINDFVRLVFIEVFAFLFVHIQAGRADFLVF